MDSPRSDYHAVHHTPGVPFVTRPHSASPETPWGPVRAWAGRSRSRGRHRAPGPAGARLTGTPPGRRAGSWHRPCRSPARRSGRPPGRLSRRPSTASGAPPHPMATDLSRRGGRGDLLVQPQVAAHQVAEIPAAQPPDRPWLNALAGGISGRPVQEGELAEVVARVEEAQPPLNPFPAHLDRPLANDIERIPRLALADEGVPAVEIRDCQLDGQQIQLPLVEI